jgi:hypothetical protein
LAGVTPQDQKRAEDVREDLQINNTAGISGFRNTWDVISKVISCKLWEF